MKICPVCHGDFYQRTAKGKQGTIELDVCEGCGGIWFDNQELRETVHVEDVIQHATQLDHKKAKYCPRCGALLKPNHKTTATHNISEYKCLDCRGELVVGITMKKKVTRRMGVLFTVLGLGLVGLFSYLTVNFTTSTEIRATDLISKPIITQLSSLETSITFTTSTPIRTELILTAPYLSNKRRVVVSSTPRTIHQLTIDGLVLNQQHSYQIVLIDNKGAERLSSKYRYTPR